MDVKVGDTVHVRGVVEHLRNSELTVRFKCCPRGGETERHHFAPVAPPEIVHVEPRPLVVGDKVTRKQAHPMSEDGGARQVGGILGIMDEYAWVFWRHRPVTVPLADLVRA